MAASSSATDEREQDDRSVVGRIAVVVLLATLTLIGLVFPFPVDGRLWNEVFDLAHAPAFCCLLLTVAGVVDPASVGFSGQAYRIRRIESGELMVLAGACLMLGFLGEFLQRFVGRSPSFGDLAANATGVGSATLWVLSRRRQGARRNLFAGVSILILGLAVAPALLGIRGAVQQRTEFPLLASFERPNELRNWETVNARISQTAAWASDGHSALRMELFPGEFSGATMTWPVPDWKGYEWFSCDVQTLGTKSVELVTKLYDQQHANNGFEPEDRFERVIEVSPGNFRTIRIRLSDVADAPATRTLNLEQIAGIELFVKQPPHAMTLIVDNMRLLGDGPRPGIPIDRIP